MTNSPENLDNIPNQQGKESVVISPKHTYQWLASQQQPFSTEVLTVVAEDIISNATELIPNNQFWQVVFNEVALPDDLQTRGLEAIRRTITPPVAQTALARGLNLNDPDIVRMGAGCFYNALSVRINFLEQESVSLVGREIPDDSRRALIERNTKEEARLSGMQAKIRQGLGRYDKQQHLETLGRKDVKTRASLIDAREVQFINLLAQGASMPQIEQNLAVHYQRGFTLLSNLYRKLSSETPEGVILEAIRRNIISVDRLIPADFNWQRFNSLTEEELRFLDLRLSGEKRFARDVDVETYMGPSRKRAIGMAGIIAQKLGFPRSNFWVVLYHSYKNRPITQAETTTLPENLLTQKQRYLLIDVIKGMSAEQIGRREYVSESAITARYSNIYKVLGVKNQLQAVLLAIEQGYIDVNELKAGFNFSLFNRLTPKEKTTLKLVLTQSRSFPHTREIASKLNIKPMTVTYRFRMINKTLHLKGGGILPAAVFFSIWQRNKLAEITLTEQATLKEEERSLLVMIGEGLSSEEIAAKRQVDVGIINIRLNELYRVLGVKNRLQSALVGISLGYIDVDELTKDYNFSLFSQLTPLQMRILDASVQEEGRHASEEEIVRRLNISSYAVETNRSLIYFKLGITNPARAAVLYLAFKKKGQAGELKPSRERLPITLEDYEKHLLTLIAQGLSRDEIAGKLRIATATASKYLQKILNKLQVSNSLQAIISSVERGILSLDTLIERPNLDLVRQLTTDQETILDACLNDKTLRGINAKEVARSLHINHRVVWPKIGKLISMLHARTLTQAAVLYYAYQKEQSIAAEPLEVRGQPVIQQETAVLSAEDQAIFEQLYQQHYKKIRSYNASRATATNTNIDPDEITQEAFMRLHNRLPEIPDKSDPNALLKYLYRIATNLILDKLKREQIVRFTPLDDSETIEPGRRPFIERLKDPSIPEDFAQDLIQMEKSQKVQKVLGMLPENYRDVLDMHYFQGMTFEEIARVLGTTPGAVKALAYRAREMFESLYPNEE